MSGPEFEYAFDTEAGSLQHLRYQNQELLSGGPKLNAARMPIMNEVSTWGEAEIDSIYTWGLDSLIHETHDFETIRLDDERIRIRFDVTSYSNVTREMKLDNRFVYTIHGNGMIRLDHTVTPSIEIPGWPIHHIQWFQKMGLGFTLSGDMQNLEWFGRGPFETYPDRKTGAKTGIHSLAIKDIHIPYIIPQDFGNRTDVTENRVQSTEYRKQNTESRDQSTENRGQGTGYRKPVTEDLLLNRSCFLC